ncbi:MAG TPA: hypothetical protein VKB84_10815 [Candidatus Binataceae bacterium]|nr:hypothetical protein [Candidatus Binataceae bacterium]
MSFKAAVPKSLLMIAAGVCAAMFASAGPTHAQQLQILGASPPPQQSAPEMIAGKRLILHDIDVSRTGATIKPSSKPVLDYAVLLLRQYPDTLVSVSAHGDRTKLNRQAQAVAEYLKERGVSADRVVVQKVQPKPFSNAIAPSASSDTGVIVLNLTAPDCSACPS